MALRIGVSSSFFLLGKTGPLWELKWGSPAQAVLCMPLMLQEYHGLRGKKSVSPVLIGYTKEPIQNERFTYGSRILIRGIRGLENRHSRAIYVGVLILKWIHTHMISTKPERNAADDLSQRPMRLSAVGSEDSRRELVRRIVRSPTFARCERLGALLTYICDLTIKGREAEINEHRVGEAVFGRSQNYDSAVDGIVRSQASRLRQRLDLYFQQEGADEPVRITIPRGRYVPMFEAQSKSVLEPMEAKQVENRVEFPAPSSRVPEVRTKGLLRRWQPWVLSLVLASALITLWFRDRRVLRPAAAPATHPFWSHMFIELRPTMVVAPDSGLVLFHGLSGQDVDLKGYLDAGYRSKPNGPSQVGPAVAQKDWLFDLANRRYSSMVDFEAILRLKERAQALRSPFLMRYARDLRPNDFKIGDVILLGASSANPWVELFEQNMNFVLKDDYRKNYWVLNRSPQKGEPSRWETARSDPEQRVFGLVAYLPNLRGDGNALLLEGTSMSGTEAATDFVEDDAQLLPFLDRIRHPDGTLPHFELLLETHNMDASAVRNQILAWRITK